MSSGITSYGQCYWVCQSCGTANEDMEISSQKCGECGKLVELLDLEGTTSAPDWCLDEVLYRARRAEYESRGEKMPKNEVNRRSNWRRKGF